MVINWINIEFFYHCIVDKQHRVKFGSDVHVLEGHKGGLIFLI